MNAKAAHEAGKKGPVICGGHQV
jgi:hypothetical protein